MPSDNHINTPMCKAMCIHSGRKLRNLEVPKVAADIVSKVMDNLCPWGNMWGCVSVYVCVDIYIGQNIWRKFTKMMFIILSHKRSLLLIN